MAVLRLKLMERIEWILLKKIKNLERFSLRLFQNMKLNIAHKIEDKCKVK